jgi:glycerol-3-phosphate O-acyltransferase
MEPYLKSSVLELLDREKKFLPKDVFTYIHSFFSSYDQLILNQCVDSKKIHPILQKYIDLIKQEIQYPTQFENFHRQERVPFDYYQFAKELINPFIDKEKSHILGRENIEDILSLLKGGENVILLANHQAEGDPTLLSALLDDHYPHFIQEMIAIAGARVRTDPLTIPLIRGQHVLCVYSKKYFDLYADKKMEMLQHNSTSMLVLRDLLSQGGKLVFVAPSGGRDRKDDSGRLLPSPFDPDSIEMMRIVGSKGKKATHFFPLALHTYHILPPPEKIKKEIGEQRKMCHSPIHVNFGKKFHMLAPNSLEKGEKTLFRKHQADKIYQEVLTLYDEIIH